MDEMLTLKMLSKLVLLPFRGVHEAPVFCSMFPGAEDGNDMIVTLYEEVKQRLGRSGKYMR